MQFPKRADEHIKESAGWKVFQNTIPNEWIIRDVTERDYGIDAYVEITTNDEVSGNLFLIQLKTTNKIEWKENYARFSGIKKTTINYWYHLPVPVFLFWIELNTKNLYFASVKEQIRGQYQDFINENIQTMSFGFLDSLNLGSDVGKKILLYFYFREKNFKQFKNNLVDLLIHYEEYKYFIEGNQGRDCFLDVDDERQLVLKHVYGLCQLLAGFFDIEWNVIGLVEAYQKDLEEWDDHCSLHENTLSIILSELEPIFYTILEKAQEYVVNIQENYWTKEDPLLVRMCGRLNVEYLRNRE